MNSTSHPSSLHSYLRNRLRELPADTLARRAAQRDPLWSPDNLFPIYAPSDGNQRFYRVFSMDVTTAATGRTESRVGVITHTISKTSLHPKLFTVPGTLSFPFPTTPDEVSITIDHRTRGFRHFTCQLTTIHDEVFAIRQHHAGTSAACNTFHLVTGVGSDDLTLVEAVFGSHSWDHEVQGVTPSSGDDTLIEFSDGESTLIEIPLDSHKPAAVPQIITPLSVIHLD